MKAFDLQGELKQGAGCLLFLPATKKFLLIKRSDLVPMPLHWCLPGGSVDPGEAATDAAKRELFEETGYELTSPMHLIYTNDTYAPRFKFYNYASIIDKPFKPVLNWESVDFGWFTIDDLPSPMHWGLKQLLNSERAAKKLKKLVDKELFD